jgi:hypothetical protein
MSREFIYDMKREYGHSATFVHTISSEVDVNTGGDNIQTVTYDFQRVAFLAVDIAREIFAPARSSAYPYGDFYDLSMSLILIDKHDCPEGFLINNNDYVIVDGVKYGIKFVRDLHHSDVDAIHVIVEELEQRTNVLIPAERPRYAQY